MNGFLQLRASLLALILAIAGCAMPYTKPPSKPVVRAPVVDRSTRQTLVYPTQPSRPSTPSQVEVGQLPREDPLVPREYSSSHPGTRYPAERYPDSPAPAYPDAYGAAPAAPSSPSYSTPPSAAYPSPAYPPGAAYSSPAYPAYPDSLDGPSDVDPFAETASTPPPARQPVVPPAAVPAPADEAIALAPPTKPATEPRLEPDVPETPPQEPAPAPRRPTPPPRPAELPPAEITREGNQAVVALLDSADKYVKSNQLDKAGAALERALRIEPRNAGIWHDLAQIRLHQGQYQQAESLASKSSNLAGSNRSLQARNWKLISVARKASGNTAGAEEAEAQALLLSR
ncbi:MAG: tetratricopeptide repeat protein [Gammaproteobacteria bacterium]|nr:tetratricopeptide repeat protein [Gammaproteobacteria bacterium]